MTNKEAIEKLQAVEKEHQSRHDRNPIELGRILGLQDAIRIIRGET